MTININRLITATNNLYRTNPDHVQFDYRGNGYMAASIQDVGYVFDFEALQDVAVFNGFKETDDNTVDENQVIEILSKHIANKLSTSDVKPFPNIKSRY